MHAEIDDATDAGDRQVSVVASPKVKEAFDEQLARRLQDWLAEVLATEFADSGALTVMLQSDDEIAELNRRFRNRPHATDVLSFPGGEGEIRGRYLGDVAISLQTAARQATNEGHSLFQEVRLLALHGLLHCAGYDHEVDEGEMDLVELDLRDKWLGDHG